MTLSKFSHIYNDLNNLDSYENWLDFVLMSLAGSVESALDVACGTGYLTEMMAPFVQEMTGVDLDEGMVQTAQENYGNISNLNFEVADMLDLSNYYNRYDLVTCFLDSLNFLKSKDDVKKALEELVNCLKPGGLLLFDVWTPYQLNVVFKDFEYADLTDEYGFFWKSQVSGEEEEPLVDHHLTVFSQAESNNYQRLDGVLTERAYTLDLYQDTLAKLDIADYEILVGWGEREYDENRDQNTPRWFFRCWKGD